MKHFLWTVLCCICISTAYGGQTPRRIISLAPSITESLYQLGLEDRVIAVTSYCPKGTRQKEIIGTLWEPNIEKILALSPDLVIASKEGNRKGAILKLRELGLNVCIIDEDHDFSTLCSNYLALSKAVGREQKAQEIIERTLRGLETVRQRTAAEKPVRVFWEVGARPLFTISKRSFINDFNTYTGSNNIFDDINRRYPKISREEVIRRDPDAIIIVAMGDVTRSEHAYWRQFTQLKAVRDNRIYIVESQEIFTPTPPTFLKGVEYIAALLHPTHE